ncbi:MAG: Flp family type IVb pilin [Pseudooceanicola sp.]
MRDFIISNLRRIRLNDEGVTLVEYGLAMAVALGVSAASYTLLSGNIGGSMDASANVMPQAQAQ